MVAGTFRPTSAAPGVSLLASNFSTLKLWVKLAVSAPLTTYHRIKNSGEIGTGVPVATKFLRTPLKSVIIVELNGPSTKKKNASLYPKADQ